MKALLKQKLINKNKKKEYIIAIATGTGVSAKHAVNGGVDFILALNSGRFRQMGVSSLAGFLPVSNCNSLVMEFGSREILPIAKSVPVILGLCATDPLIDLENFINKIKSSGFAGINNYPSVGMIDGLFGEALEEENISYSREVEAIKIANEKGLFTIAFVFNKEQAIQMLNVGADVICVHFGFTKGGLLGAKKVLTLVEGVQLTKEIFEACDQESDREVIKMIYGGSVYTPTDLKYMYDNTSTMGYIGGSAFERIPIENAIPSLIEEFKNTGSKESDEFLIKMLEGVKKHYDYVGFVKEYIKKNYMHSISLFDLAQVSHISRPYLSQLFGKEVGCSFRDYLTNFRMNKAKEIIKQKKFRLVEVAEMVGYKDYAHFSKVFKKSVGTSPREFQEKGNQNV
ncbi:phosphoenolpyruvate hydrolase family protein [Fredinandcohnia sp. QZ13]|uniref:phosphoenolpyruvate hydrolase family protein n=1 Tax=Fredinandcohnia sp. QZ13 TaxID=3073144 RepID=UPI002852FDA3|nr:phosphoenolpyruvate hydrolase family protein [Fredinandcohnia sp. QZ13]MDR4887891.1 phosphoenolpyruvate hydrolase family protein [Fredinandcohnia sp. QZ13]